MKLQSKFLLALLPPVIVFLAGLGIWSARLATQGIDKTAADYLQGVLHTFVTQELENRRQILVKNQLDKVPSFVRLYKQEAAEAASAVELLWPGHIFAFDSEGKLVFDTSGGNPEKMQTVWDPVLAEIKKSPNGDYGHINEEMYRYAAFQPWGWQVFVAIDDSDVHDAEVRIYWITLLIALGAAAVISGVLGLVFRKFVVSPIAVLSDAAGLIAARQPVEEISVASHDEIGDLARDIEKMSQDISLYQLQLLKLAESLELQVEERTADLMKSEAGLARAQQIAHLGSWEWDVSSGTLTWSDEVYRIFGYAPREFIPDYEKFLASIHPDDVDAVKNAVNLALSDRATYNIEHRIIHPDGEVRTVREIGEVSYDEDGRPDRMMGTVQDITEMAAAEAALRESEKQYRLLADNSKDLIYRYELQPERGFTYVSPSSSDLIGYTPDEHYADPDLGFKLIHPDDASKLNSLMNMETELENPIVLRWNHKNGGTVWMEQQNIRIFDDKGELIAIEGASRDITERKHAEQIIIDSEEMKSKILNSMQDGMALADMDGRMVQVNEAMTTIYGYSVEELTSMNALELIRPDYHRVFMEFQKQLIETGSFAGETVDIRKGGAELFTEIRGALIRLKEEPYLLAIIRDVTDRKIAEDALRESEERFRAIFESTSDCILVWDKDYNYLFANQAAIDQVGAQREQVIGKNIREGLGHVPDFMNLWISRIDRAVHFGKSFRVEDADQIGDRTAYSESVVSPIMGRDGQVFAVGVVYRDITDRKEMEQAISEHAHNLAQTNLELRKKNTELDEFTYVASHDLQEPLRKITAFSSLLQKDLGEDMPERARLDLHYIVDAAGRMQTLVQDLLLLSRTGRAALKQTMISPRKCAQKALDALSVRLAETGAEIIWDDLPEVLGDESLLVQLYQNLIGNGLKFIGQDSPVIHISFERENGDIVYGVKDNGIGIKPDYTEQIFSPFKRLHSRAEYEGSGIGLAICRKIVEMHGGRLWVESEPGRGAHFKFTLQPAERSLNDA